MEWHSVEKNVAISKLSSAKGLSSSKVFSNREKFGSNRLLKPAGKPFFKRLISALFDPMIIILLFSTCVTFGVNFGKFIRTGEADFIESIGIVFAIILSVSVTLIMEGSSQKAFDALSSVYQKTVVTVIRDGAPTVVNQDDLVVGDLVLLSAGEKVVADGRLIESQDLLVDESAITGESLSVRKNADEILPSNTPLAERKNCVYSGSFIVSGGAKCVVTGVGNLTEIGKIANEVGKKKESPSPLEEKLAKLSKRVTILGSIIALLVFVLTIAKNAVVGTLNFSTVQETFISCIVLIVAVVPEGLPTIVAISLALNMIKLAKSNALIKKLTATETTGAVSVICSDKTGTLTENKMRVVKVCTTDFCSEPKAIKEEVLFENFCINSTAEIVTVNKVEKEVGSASECAILRAYERATNKPYRELRETAKIITRMPFSSETKMMQTTAQKDGKTTTFVKGAPEVVLPLCDLTEREKDKIIRLMTEYEKDAGRVLCFAHQSINDQITVNNGLHFDGFVVIADTIRKDVLTSVKTAKRAGIDVKMLTGDNLFTAIAIAKQTGILQNVNQAVTASDIERLSDDDLKKSLKNIKVIARSTPLIKLRVVKLLKELGEVVAVTGDGINDAPAIRQADVGIAMGIAGSEITKEASDVVLLNDSFSTIVKAIEFGRSVYANLQRFIYFQLSVNFSALIIVVVSLLFGMNPPFTSLQLLWINLIMDGPPALTLGLEGMNVDLLNKKPISRNAPLVSKSMLLKTIVTAIFTASVTLLEYRYDFLKLGSNRASTGVFTVFVLFQLFNAFNARELGTKSIFKSFTKNKIMLITFALAFVLQFLIVTFGASIFSTTPLYLSEWGKILLLSSSVVAFSEIFKAVYNKINAIKHNKKGENA